MEVHELVEQIRQGKDVRSAQDELYRRVYERLGPLLARKVSEPLRRRLDVDDVIHEAFMQAMGALDRFESRHPEAFFAWIYRIAMNRSLYMAHSN